MEEQKRVPKLRFAEFSDDWKRRNLGETCEVKTGNKDTKNKVDEGKYPFYVRSNTIEKIDTYSYDGEAILTSGDGVGVGKNFHYVNGKFDYHQRVYALKVFKEGFNAKFIYQVFSEKFYRRVLGLSAKNSVDSVRMDFITKMKIGFPSLPEQQKIATFLSSVDKKIQQLQQKQTLLEQYKKGVMQRIFPSAGLGQAQQLRFTKKNGSGYPDWEEKRLGEVARKESSNISANRIEDNFGEYKVYGATGFIKSIDFYEVEEDYISIVKDGAGVGRTLLCEAKSSVLGTLDIIKPKKDVNLYFLYSLLNNLNFIKYITGSTIPHIYFKDYSRARIKIPCKEEQTQIAHFLSAIDTKIAVVQTQIEHTQRFKKGLLQQMFV